MDEVLTPARLDGDADAEVTLRPKRLEEFVGQPRLKDQLGLVLEGARRRGDAADHVLLSGPPGLGKTSLAGIIAAELEAELRPTSGPALERAGDLAALLTNLDAGDVLFVDEIHRLARQVEEVLYSAMEDFHLDIVVGKGPGARALRLPLPPFTLVGATTRTGMVTGPLRDRFGFAARLEYYDPSELATILRRSAGILKIEADDEGTLEVARRSRGTPRIANRLLKRVRDYAEVRGDGRVGGATARAALALFDVDARGLDRLDRQVLEALCVDFAGGPVGLSTLAVAVGEAPETVEDVVEPFLITEGMLARTPRGRIATGGAWRHLDLPPPAPTQPGGGSPAGPSLFDGT